MKLLRCLVVFLLLSTITFTVVAAEVGKEISPVAVPDSLPATGSHSGNVRNKATQESIYKINIKETRTNKNLLVRILLPGYKNKAFRTLLISYNTYFPKPLDEYYTLIIEKAFHFPVVFFILLIIVALVGNVLVVIGILFLTNRIMNFSEKKRRKTRSIFEKIITDLMLNAIDIPTAVQLLSTPQLKKSGNLLIDVLIEFQKSFRGDADRQIIELYQKMDLGRISYNKTFAISIYKQVRGIHELANMHPYHAVEMIASRLNDPNDIVRTEAQICYPHANRESPFDFLYILEKSFSDWAQLNIYYFIKIHEMPVPSFEKWMNSKHPNVVNFCIRMIDLFQQQEHSAQILKMLSFPDETTRNLAIIACRNLLLFDSKEILKKSFRTESIKIQTEITRTILVIGDDDDIPFLEGILQTEVISLRLEACRTMYNLSDTSRAYLNKLNQSLNFILTPYIAHIQDPRN